jgi:hypothetical protein
MDIAGHRRDTTFSLPSEDVLPTGGVIVSADKMALAVFEAAGIYYAFDGRITRIASSDVAPTIGHAYRFEPTTIPFRQMAQVHLKVPPGQESSRLGVYELTDKGWAFVWNDVDSIRNTVWAGVRNFSVYALLEDNVAPMVEIREPLDGTITPSLPTIRVVLSDSMSGIPMEELITFELDQQAMIFEYDPEEDTAIGLLRRPLAPGNHALVVRVKDTSGNETVASSRFVVGTK